MNINYKIKCSFVKTVRVDVSKSFNRENLWQGHVPETDKIMHQIILKESKHLKPGQDPSPWMYE